MGYAVKIGAHAVGAVTGAEHTSGTIAAESTSISTNLRKRFNSADLRLRSGKDESSAGEWMGRRKWLAVRQLCQHAHIGDIRKPTAKPGPVLAHIRREPEHPTVGDDIKVSVVRSRSTPVSPFSTAATAGSPYTPSHTAGPLSAPTTPNLYSHLDPLWGWERVRAGAGGGPSA